MKAGSLEFRHHTKLTEYAEAAKISVTGGGTGTESCPLTHPIVDIDSSSAAITAFNLANGYPGQMITIVTSDDNNVDIIPATSTIFASIALDTTGDTAVLLYVDDTTGWKIEGLFSVIVNNSPAYAVAA